MKVEFGSFPERRRRSEYIATRFRDCFAGRLLDVGCDRAPLKELLPDIEYFGIDVVGTPDRLVDLEKENGLPFADASFDCVVCADVLEHLNNLHHIFAELIRVTRGHVVLSLPNNWTNARLPLTRGEGQIGHYGLPVDPPADRHKWFFSLTEAEAFLRGQSARLPFEVVDLFAMEKRRPAMVRWMRRIACGRQDRYLNRYAHTLWAVLRKKPG
jgi:SAM-dependent methyltransferase